MTEIPATQALMGLLVGLAAGLHSATWGMYKDAPHEGFTWRTYVRSPIVASLIGLALTLFTSLDPTTAPGVVVLWAVTYGLERACLEVYKSFIRVEDQSKYTIPMQFAVRGRVVESAPLRLLAGAAYVGGASAVLYAIHRFQGAPSQSLHPVLVVFLVGSAGGWISAFGGAWKDAPIEGFHTFKFFRSPAMAFGYGLLVASLTTNYVFIFLGAIGFTVATIETYKTFFFPDRPRGKFQGKEPAFPEYLTRRARFVPVFVLVWLGVLTAVVLALLGPRHGLI
ncbi:MAG: hypothetical protein D6701_03580 [Gemmatimonadetes bacterium]|nr:MAG: hypothetical protein D6701_03580 [Gemmatimonadota bacterium]